MDRSAWNEHGVSFAHLHLSVPNPTHSSAGKDVYHFFGVLMNMLLMYRCFGLKPAVCKSYVFCTYGIPVYQDNPCRIV